VRRPQLRAGVEPEVVGEPGAHRRVHGQRGGLVARLGQREHQPGLHRFRQRVAVRRLAQRGQHLLGQVGCQRHVGRLPGHGQVLLVDRGERGMPAGGGQVAGARPLGQVQGGRE
jgi:hypothetical protein